MKTNLVVCRLLVCLVIASATLHADEGMWTYNNFPKDKVKAKYGFAASQEWLDHVQLSSVRFSTGGSGAFVSAGGLTFTNHHVAADCIHDLSVAGKDYVKDGFYAPTPVQEMRCPDMSADQLLSINDVTSTVNANTKPGMSDAEVAQAQRTAMSDIEHKCSTSPEIRCEVVALYSGAVFNLYKYKRYSDVRLVFAPEFDIAFFGGDPDNYTYPRYDLDIAFFRVYENGTPARLENYLRWSTSGARENELVFASGDPGATNRLKTVAQLEFLRDVYYRVLIETQRRWIDSLQKFADESPENARISQEFIYGAKNGFKAFVGSEAGLQNQAVMDMKRAAEQRFRALYDAKHHDGPDPWQRISDAMKAETEIYMNLTYLERMRGFADQLSRYGRQLVRAAEERNKPSGDRLREFSDSALPGLEQRLFASTPVNKRLDAAILAESFVQMRDYLSKTDYSEIAALFHGASPEDAAKAFVEGSKLDDPAVRKQLYEGGESAIEASTDPMIVLMRSVDAKSRAVRRRYDDEVDSVEKSEGTKLAQARFAEYGFGESPDATSTLRLSYGAVRGYADGGKPVPFSTTIDGAFKHAAEHENTPPYKLPDSWTNAKPKLSLSTPLDFVSTADVIGGNSGSPVVNTAGEVVGIVFDANTQALASNFVYSDEAGRAISVDVRAIQEVLRKVYNATALDHELTEGATQAHP
jgi:Peptidase S46